MLAGGKGGTLMPRGLCTIFELCKTSNFVRDDFLFIYGIISVGENNNSSEAGSNIEKVFSSSGDRPVDSRGVVLP